jgi:hypothetical protein
LQRSYLFHLFRQHSSAFRDWDCSLVDLIQRRNKHLVREAYDDLSITGNALHEDLRIWVL